MHRGSSLIIFFTSFHVDVKVIFEKTNENINTIPFYSGSQTAAHMVHNITH